MRPRHGDDDYDGPTRAEAERDAYEESREVRTEENACPECAEGIVVAAGRVERETGWQPVACDRSCGWSA